MDIIGSDKSLQNHWIKRLLAIIIDSIIVWIIGAIIFYLVLIPLVAFGGLGLAFVLPITSGLLLFIYSMIMEMSSGATLGKKVMKLRVISTGGEMDAGKAAIRNISKIYGLFLLIDWLIGFITDGDPKQKFLDRTAGTTVIITTILSDQQQHTYQSQQAKYAPPPQQGYQSRHEQTYQYPPPPATSFPPPQQGGYQPPPEPAQICNSCGGRMNLTGNGRLQCIRCGKIQ